MVHSYQVGDDGAFAHRRSRQRIDRIEEPDPQTDDSVTEPAAHQVSRDDRAVQRAPETTVETESCDGPGGSTPGTTTYQPGPDVQRLSDRYGMDLGTRGDAERVQRLADDFGTERVQRWAEEGMPVETMGKPRDMQAFRERQEARPDAVPTDVERRNRASVRRNASGAEQEDPAGDAGAPDPVRNVISSPGRSIESSVQREMESKMGGDFSDVQVHTGPQAAAAADTINARAFTAGNHVAFNDGEYQPGTEEGQKVLAHELTHVRQQTGGAVSLLPKADAEHPGLGIFPVGDVHVQPKLEVSSPDDPAEKEAEAVAERVVQMDRATRAEPSGAGNGGERGGLTRHSGGGHDPTSESVERRGETVASGDGRHAAAASSSFGGTQRLVRTTGEHRVDRFLGGIGSGIENAVGSAVEFVEDAIESLFDSVSDAVNAIAEGAVEFGEDLWNYLENAGEAVWEELKGRTEAVANMLREGGRRAWRFFEEGGEAVWDVLKSLGREAWAALEENWWEAWSLLRRNTAVFVGMLAEGGALAWDFLKDGGIMLWQTLKESAYEAWQALKDGADAIWDFVAESWERFVDFLVSMGEWAWDLLKRSAYVLWNFVWDVPQRLARVVELLARAAIGVPNWFYGGLYLMFTLSSDIDDWLVSGILDGPSWVGKLVTSLLDLLAIGELADLLGQILKPNTRPLTSEEQSETGTVIANAVNYDVVRIDEHSLIAELGRWFEGSDSMAVTTFHTINFSGTFEPAAGNDDMAWLVHELAHVGQYEAVGSRYMPESIHAQQFGGGYSYEYDRLANESFSSFNREQQASILGDYYALVLNDATNHNQDLQGEPGDFFTNYESNYQGTYESHIEDFQNGRF